VLPHPNLEDGVGITRLFSAVYVLVFVMVELLVLPHPNLADGFGITLLLFVTVKLLVLLFLKKSLTTTNTSHLDVMK
jgi:hypothetical protein